MIALLRKSLHTSLLLVVLAVLVLVAFRAVSGPSEKGWQPSGPAVAIDLNQPDVFVDSSRLSALPRDMLKVPLLKTTLSEDFVFYYEQNEARLSLSGTLRRLAYERKLELGDELVSALLNRPGQLAFWRGKDGTLRYWMLAVDRSGLPALAQRLAKVALSDTQLHAAGYVVNGTEKVPLLSLEYGSGRTLLLVNQGERLLVFSDPAMAIEANPNYPSGKADTDNKSNPNSITASTRVVDGRSDAILAYLDSQGGDVLRKHFASKAPATDGHQLVVQTNYLSFGYQSLFPAIQALGFRLEGRQWQSQALLDPAKMPAASAKPDVLWRAMPGQAAACTMLPVQAHAAQPVLDVAAGSPGASSPLLDAISSPVGICWYAKSGFSAPLFAVALKDEASAKAQATLMGQIFANAIGTREFKLGEPDSYNRFPVKHSTGQGAAQMWQRTVSARYGVASAAKFSDASSLSAGRYFPVTLGQSGRFVYFSPDARLVEDALSVMAGKFPSVVDGLPQPANLWLRMDTGQLAKLLETSVLDSVPADQEPIFHDVAVQRVLPRLKALATQHAYSLRLPTSLPRTTGWTPINWVAE